MGFRSLEATNARVTRRTRREIFLHFFFFLALSRADDFFFLADVLLVCLVEDCGWYSAALDGDKELPSRINTTANAGTRVFTCL